MNILTRPYADTQETLLDKQNILQLIQFERFCRDNALWAEMKKCFHHDSTVNISWFNGSGEGFVDASAKMEAYAPHKIYNTGIWLNGDKAVAIMCTTIQMVGELDGVPMELACDSKLIFRVVRENGQWYIYRFESIYEKDKIQTRLPNNQLHIDASVLADYPQSYACMAYNMERHGMSVNRNLAGMDRPETVEKLYGELNAWLNA